MKSFAHSRPKSQFIALLADLAELFPRLFLFSMCIVAIAPGNVQAQTYIDMHDYNCSTDGCASQYPGTIAQGTDGNLYSSLPGGGTPNYGTVYDITLAGTFNKLYNFSGTDGYGPYSGLTLGTDGNFYGATYNDGPNGYGTLFKITPAGTLTPLHNFTAAEEGGAWGTPVESKKPGIFYGVTYYGKAYSITSTGTFKLLPNPIPGSSYTPLVLGSDGNFYGTSLTGGLGYGTVFRLSATGAVKIIYSFDGTHG